MFDAWTAAKGKAQKSAQMRESKMVNARNKAAKIQDSAYTAGIIIDELMAVSLALGGEINVKNRHYIASRDGDLFALARGIKDRSTALRQFIERLQTAFK